jgi:cobalt-zinc-cadmium efflux system outer membrane protein
VKWALAVGFVVCGCATVSPERGHDEVGRLVAERAGTKTGWEQGTPAETAISEKIDALLGQRLTRQSAVAIALLNNPGLQRTYEELGVSQAQMIQAGLLKNPTLAGSIGFPLAVASIEYEFSLIQQIIDLFTLPARKETAANQFRADTLRVAHEALQMVAAVNRAFVSFQAELESTALVRRVLHGATAAHQLSEKQRVAGNVSELAVATERASYSELQLQVTQAEVRVAAAREQLNRLLGLWGKRARWEAAETLATLPPADSIPEHPENLAVRQRLDLEAARLYADALARAVGLARSTRLFGQIEVGAHFHQDPDGPRLLGPNLVLDLPIFDQRQPYIAGLEAEHRAASRRVSELAVEARSRVREGLLALEAARAVSQHYETYVVPLREQVVEQSQLHYNGMLLGLPQLMAAKLTSLETQRSAIGARSDYWRARFELELTLGGALKGDKP